MSHTLEEEKPSLSISVHNNNSTIPTFYKTGLYVEVLFGNRSEQAKIARIQKRGNECSRYLNRLIRRAREEQVSSGVDTETPDGTLVAHKCPLTLEDLLGVVCYTQAERRHRVYLHFSLEKQCEENN